MTTCIVGQIAFGLGQPFDPAHPWQKDVRGQDGDLTAAPLRSPSLISARDASNKQPNGPIAPCTTSRACLCDAAEVAALAHLGDLDEARAELTRLLAIDPRMTIAGYRAYAGHFLASAVLELQVTGLRLAGMPED
jgi:hypothetical protein